ncbi:tRNA (adenosine(37)-N6)-threonylcarbamoyltransferase complex dimerization subunit type 1 TsaB [Sphingomonas sp. MMS24-J45]|uniref:tRNA (adenosine(37)-N6)-threonylcarbamoyltransferase complex dimerization subunit type 1 TsaB n=1 Tax=Sphingomonas sp. MMS24-J45 TaxID=3238806 RepID=UPI00384F063F
MRTLVIETATAACSVALIENGVVIARAHETVGRGHAEHLIPMIARLPDGGRAGHILVDCGPGSFTGIRVGVAAARGLALGWGATLAGYSSLAALAARAFADGATADELAVVLEGGHGEVFMQSFAMPLSATQDLVSLRPDAALAALGGRIAVGNGVRHLTGLDASLEVQDRLPEAADAVFLPSAFTVLEPKPLYGRAPDAKPMAAA